MVDIATKISLTTAIGCHLGYDHRRRAHFIFVPELSRFSTFRVVSWLHENEFTVARSIRPHVLVSFHQMHDLPSSEAAVMDYETFFGDMRPLPTLDYRIVTDHLGRDGLVGSNLASVSGVAFNTSCDSEQAIHSFLDDGYTATLAATSLRMLAAIIADLGLAGDQWDAYKAFTQSDVDAIIFVEIPHGFITPGYALRLNKALEGIKQGAHLWFGFVNTLNELNLDRHSVLDIFVGVFADDILSGFSEPSRDAYLKIKEEYAAHIKVETMQVVPPTVFIGVEIQRDIDVGTLTISQARCISRVFDTYNTEIGSPTPSTYGTREQRAMFDKLAPAPEADRIETAKYLKLCGILIWVATMTRPDIQYAASFLCSFARCAGPEHYRAALAVLGYLYKTREMGITYGGTLKLPMGADRFPDGFVESRGLHVHHDSSWGKDVKPWGGHVVMYMNGAVAWKSSKLRIVANSTAEAEIAASSTACTNLVDVRNLLTAILCPPAGPSPAFMDNKATRNIIVKTGRLRALVTSSGRPRL